MVMNGMKRAGHRSWAARGAPVAGTHRGDIMSADKRSALMSRIKGSDTKPELALAACLIEKGLKYERHSKDLPGKPDFVFRAVQLAVFVDGDYWHGFRFPLWRHKLSPFWQEKIGKNRLRDRRNFAKLRRQGWKVIRLWEHQIETNVQACADRVQSMVAQLSKSVRSDKRPNHGSHERRADRVAHQLDAVAPRRGIGKLVVRRKTHPDR